MLWKTYLAKEQLRYDRNRVTEFFKNLEKTSGVVDDKHVSFVYNAEAPELSYILIEDI